MLINRDNNFTATKLNQQKNIFLVQGNEHSNNDAGLMEKLSLVKHYRSIQEVRNQMQSNAIHNSSLLIRIINGSHTPGLHWFLGCPLSSHSIVSTCQQAHQMIFMTGQKYPTGFFPVGLTGSRASRTRVSRGSRTKAAFVSESANHLIITLTSQV